MRHYDELPMHESRPRCSASPRDLLAEWSPQQPLVRRIVPFTLILVALLGSFCIVLRSRKPSNLGTAKPEANFIGLASAQEYQDFAWMWGDAGNLLFGHSPAEGDLLRWSDWNDSEATMRQLEAYRAAHGTKPVEMLGRKSTDDYRKVFHRRPVLEDVQNRQKMFFTDIDAAIQYLGGHAPDYSWMWGDAGNNLLGHDVAELDPIRWSDWMSSSALAAHMRARKGPADDRLVEIRRDGGSNITYGSLTEAIQAMQAISNGQGMQNSTISASPMPATAPRSAIRPTVPPKESDKLSADEDSEKFRRRLDDTENGMSYRLALSPPDASTPAGSKRKQAMQEAE